MEAAGIEPEAISVLTDLPLTTCADCPLPCAARALQNCGTKCPVAAEIDADLLLIVRLWPSTNDSIKFAIVQLLQVRDSGKVGSAIRGVHI